MARAGAQEACNDGIAKPHDEAPRPATGRIVPPGLWLGQGQARENTGICDASRAASAMG